MGDNDKLIEGPLKPLPSDLAWFFKLFLNVGGEILSLQILLSHVDRLKNDGGKTGLLWYVSTHFG
jgi:hypothetical protein